MSNPPGSKNTWSSVPGAHARLLWSGVGVVVEVKLDGFQYCDDHREEFAPCYFLKVPLEIRHLIYGYLFSEEPRPIDIFKRTRKKGTVCKALFRVSRQIHDETTRFFYARVYYFPWKSAVGPEILRHASIRPHFYLAGSSYECHRKCDKIHKVVERLRHHPSPTIRVTVSIFIPATVFMTSYPLPQGAPHVVAAVRLLLDCFRTLPMQIDQLQVRCIIGDASQGLPTARKVQQHLVQPLRELHHVAQMRNFSVLGLDICDYHGYPQLWSEESFSTKLLPLEAAPKTPVIWAAYAHIDTLLRRWQREKLTPSSNADQLTSLIHRTVGARFDEFANLTYNVRCLKAIWHEAGDIWTAHLKDTKEKQTRTGNSVAAIDGIMDAVYREDGII